MEPSLPAWALPLKSAPQKKEEPYRVEAPRSAHHSVNYGARRATLTTKYVKSAFEPALRFEKRFLQTQSAERLKTHRCHIETKVILSRARVHSVAVTATERMQRASLAFDVGTEHHPVSCDPSLLYDAAKTAILGRVTMASNRAAIKKLMLWNQRNELPPCKTMLTLLGSESKPRQDAHCTEERLDAKSATGEPMKPATCKRAMSAKQQLRHDSKPLWQIEQLPNTHVASPAPAAMSVTINPSARGVHAAASINASIEGDAHPESNLRQCLDNRTVMCPRTSAEPAVLSDNCNKESFKNSMGMPHLVHAPHLNVRSIVCNLQARTSRKAARRIRETRTSRSLHRPIIISQAFCEKVCKQGGLLRCRPHVTA